MLAVGPPTAGGTPASSHYDGIWSVAIVGTSTEQSTGQVWRGTGAQNILIRIKGTSVTNTYGMLNGRFDPATGVARLKWIYLQGQSACPIVLTLRSWTSGVLRPPNGTGKGSVRCLQHIRPHTWLLVGKATATVESRFGG